MLLAETEENESYAVGHLALGYILSKTSAKLLKTKLNIPVVLMLSIIPDIDILIPTLEHRGPTHSIIMEFIVFIPIFAIYRKKAIPYVTALFQHPLIGDYIAGGRVKLLWPMTSQGFGMSIGVKSQTNITSEWIVFLASIIIMLKARETNTLFQPHKANLILSIPTFALLTPTFLSFPLDVPTLLIPPHLVYMSMFTASIIITFSKLLKCIKTTGSPSR